MAEAAPQTETTKRMAPAVGFQQAEFARTTYEIVLPAEHTKAEMEEPTYWVNHANKLRKHTRICVIADDYSYYGEALVMAADKNSARVWFVHWIKRDAVEIPASDKYRIGQNAKGFRVIQKAGNKEVAGPYPTMSAAVNKMLELEAA